MAKLTNKRTPTLLNYSKKKKFPNASVALNSLWPHSSSIEGGNFAPPFLSFQVRMRNRNFIEIPGIFYSFGPENLKGNCKFAGKILSYYKEPSACKTCTSVGLVLLRALCPATLDFPEGEHEKPWTDSVFLAYKQSRLSCKLYISP